MEDVFIINDEDEAGVKSTIRKHLNKVRASSQTSNSIENSLANDDSVTIGIMPSGSYVNDSQQSSVVKNGGVSIRALIYQWSCWYISALVSILVDVQSVGKQI